MGINPTYIQGYASSITGIINTILVPTLISIAFIVFLWGIYTYFIAGADNEEKRKEGRTFSLYGIIGFVVLFSVWGIVNIFMGTLGLTSSNVPSFPFIGNPSAGTTNSFTGTPLNGVNSSDTTGMTDAQAQAYNAMVQAQNSYSAICSQYGTNSAQCKNASAAYEQAIGAFKDASGGSGNVGVGGTCTNNDECFGDLMCNGGKCTNPTSVGGSCSSDNDCSGNLICNQGYCVNTSGQGGTCEADSDCSGDLVCTSGSCAQPVGGTNDGLGSSCTRSSQCASGYCNDSQVCAEMPAYSLPDGASCSSGGQCQSGSCVYAVCEAQDSTGNSYEAPVYGCTSPNATNYDPSATVDNGTCTAGSSDEQNF